jgi:hypothetical protein
MFGGHFMNQSQNSSIPGLERIVAALVPDQEFWVLDEGPWPETVGIKNGPF